MPNWQLAEKEAYNGLMYIVVSRWKAKPGKEQEWEDAGRKARDIMRAQPGVKMIEGFRNGDEAVAIHCYQDEATYQRLVQDENGPFAKMSSELKIEEYAEWLGSEKGESQE